MKAKVLILSFALTSTMVQAQVNYVVSGNTAYVTNSPNVSDTITIFNTYNGCPVTSIGSGTFSQCTNLKSIFIGTNIINIGGGAFQGCTNLASVAIPDSVTSIGYVAFFGCSKLTSVVIPNSVTNLAANAGGEVFCFCSGLTNVVVGNGVTNIGLLTFGYCSNLTSIIFLGDAPTLANGPVFPNNNVTTIYYYSGTTGWGSTYGGLPTVEVPSISVVEHNITVVAATNQTVIVEASTNLVNWQPIWTNTLSSTSTNFIDSQWTSYPNRFYRAR